MTDESELNNSIKELTRQLRGGGNSGTSSSQSTKFTSSGGGFATGIPGIDSITSAAGKMTSGVTDAIGHWQQASSQLGISFNNDAIGLKTSVDLTRMKMDEWAESIDRGKLGFTALGGTMGESAKKFNQLSYAFSNTDAADRLREMGVKTGEYNQLLALTITGNTKLNKEGGLSSAEAFAAAEKLAKEMDKTAQLTGLSRKAQEDSLQEAQNNARLQVAIEDSLATGGKDAQAAFNNMNSSLQGLGIEKFGQELYVGAELSDKAKLTFAALGEAGPQLQEAVHAVRDAKTVEQRTAATAALEDAKLAVAKRESSEQFKSMVRFNGATDIGEEAGRMRTAGNNYRLSIEKQQQESLTAAKAQTDIAKTIEYSQQGKDAKGAQVSGALTTKGIVDVESRIKDTNVILGRIEQAANERAGKYLESSGALKALENVKPSTGEGIIPKGQLASAGERALGVESLTKIPGSITNASLIKDVPGIIKDGLSTLAKAGMDVTTNLIKVSAETVGIDTSKLAGTGSAIPVPGYATGTKDVLGDFGSGMMAQLHGTKAVIPKDKLNEFMSDMQTQMGVANNPDKDNITADARYKTLIARLQSSDLKQPTQQQQQTIEQPQQSTPNNIQPVAVGSVTLKDLNDQLTKLNTTMVKLVTNTTEMVDNGSKQYRATKQLSPNLNTR